MNTCSTVTDTLNTLKKEGYSFDFNLKPNCVECKSFDIELNPDDFVIDKFYRFEGESSPDDSAVVYAISAKNGLKGTVLDAYGVYADSLTTGMINKLKIRR